jgi:hypothetical protein
MTANDPKQGAVEIKDPADLSSSDSVDFCGACHSTWADVVAAAAKPVWRQAIFRLATTKIPDTCCNFFLSSLVSLLLAVPKRSAEGAKRRPCQSPFLCGTCLQLQPDAPK